MTRRSMLLACLSVTALAVPLPVTAQTSGDALAKAVQAH